MSTNVYLMSKIFPGKFKNIPLIPQRYDNGYRADAVGALVVEADAPVPFPEFFLFLEFVAAKAEVRSGLKVLQECFLFTWPFITENPYQFGMAMAVGHRLADLFHDQGLHFKREYALIQ